MRGDLVRSLSRLLPAGLALLACGGPREGAITVFAAAGLTESFRALAGAFEASRPGERVVLNFAGSHTLATQIIEGAPADLFASADRVQMDRVADAGLVERPFVFARNRLVLLVPEGNPGGVRSPADLARCGVRVVAGAPGTPIALYSNQLLDSLGLAEAVGRNVVSYEPTVKGVVGKIVLGEADAGIVYATDRVGAAAERTIAFEMPEAAGIDIAFRAAVVRGGAGRSGAVRFAEFLETEEAAEILASFGFGRP
ncbi:MAG: molybdate ABC transporter substrate-binding protein [Candidatus Eisenbacteria bacterium]